MIKDYSQYGEGKVIADYFKEFKGTLLSLGENDGKTLSNVYGLIENGWSAHLIEPSPSVFNKLESLHKGNELVKCYETAIADHNGTIKFYNSGTHLNNGDASLLSTTDLKEVEKWRSKCAFKEIEVNCMTMENFIQTSGIQNIDCISIDCEGLDFYILTKIDFKALKTKLICVEHNSIDIEKYISYMANLGYKVHFKNYCNLIFVCQ